MTKWRVDPSTRSDHECVITSQQQSANLHLFSTAYWIAFGPHGPRSEPPKNEGRKVAMYTALAVGVSFALFAGMRSFAGPAPHTMTREWQEASNEYLKVRRHPLNLHLTRALLTYQFRAKDPTPSPVSRPRATRARARSSRLPRELNSSGGFPLLIEKVARHGRMPAMYNTEVRGREVVWRLVSLSSGRDQGRWIGVYIVRPRQCRPFFVESQNDWHSLPA